MVVNTLEFHYSPTMSLEKQQTILTIRKNLEMEALVLSTLVGTQLTDTKFTLSILLYNLHFNP